MKKRTKGVIVQKYGGSSVANPARIIEVAKRVASCREKGYDVVVVVSALGDTTDELLSLAGEISKTPPERELDMLISTGEQVSVALLAMALTELGREAISFTGAQVGIITDSSHTKAKILDVSTKRIQKELLQGKIVIVAGFQGINLDQEITTLGRGGSDMTAVALAKVLKAKMCEIYTDVKGVYTADPRIVPSARKLDSISYEEMLEMASLGAQVMQARSMEVAGKFNVPMQVRSSFSTEEGTVITREVKDMEDVLVRGVTVNKGEAKVTVCDVPDKPGEASRLFERLAKADINVDMIVQNISRTKATDISFTVEGKDLQKIKKEIEKIVKDINAKDVRYDKDIAKVSVVGIGMRSHSGVAAKMFNALAIEKINIKMISTSEIKISCIVEKKQADNAVRALHKAFGLNKKRVK
ncbi:MAG: aspartate kinase [Candidatus Omnitrophota bacterium]|nr:aspartate kinase [Candidatus Omnitrophota bacterium]MBU1895226.1 aspartate kinase [Candidatus Omnitrophota bacterium]